MPKSHDSDDLEYEKKKQKWAKYEEKKQRKGSRQAFVGCPKCNKRMMSGNLKKHLKRKHKRQNPYSQAKGAVQVENRKKFCGWGGKQGKWRFDKRMGKKLFWRKHFLAAPALELAVRLVW